MQPNLTLTDRLIVKSVLLLTSRLQRIVHLACSVLGVEPQSVLDNQRHLLENRPQHKTYKLKKSLKHMANNIYKELPLQ